MPHPQQLLEGTFAISLVSVPELLAPGLFDGVALGAEALLVATPDEEPAAAPPAAAPPFSKI